MTSDDTQIRDVVTARVSAMRTGDAAGLVSGYAPDAVTFDLAPPLRNVGASATKLRNWFAGFDGPVDYEVRDLDVSISGDLAFTHSLNRMSAIPHGAPTGFELWFRSTLGLRKLDGSWTIVHEHNSTPFYMDGSLRAALDLKP